MMTWLLYTLPENKRTTYLIGLWLALVIVPDIILRSHFSTPQQFINFLCYDVVYYYMLKKGYFDR
jgi:hypothetical protein